MDWNYSVAKKHIVSKQSNISIPHFISTNGSLEWRLCQNITSLSFIISDKYAVKDRHCRVGSGWFMVSNESACPKIIIETYFNFFQSFLKVLEIFGCHLGALYKTAKRNFVRIAHSWKWFPPSPTFQLTAPAILITVFIQ